MRTLEWCKNEPALSIFQTMGVHVAVATWTKDVVVYDVYRRGTKATFEGDYGQLAFVRARVMQYVLGLE